MTITGWKLHNIYDLELQVISQLRYASYICGPLNKQQHFGYKSTVIRTKALQTSLWSFTSLSALERVFHLLQCLQSVVKNFPADARTGRYNNYMPYHLLLGKVSSVYYISQSSVKRHHLPLSNGVHTHENKSFPP